ncbi:MAG: ribosome biogenesis GTPase Der [Enterobacteriaceae bacterium]
MLPVVALVGRPNVGKSTLFNRLTRTRDALIADFPGLTRDRQYGQAKVGNTPFIVIDTAGIGEPEKGLETYMAEQSLQAIEEADVVLFMVDARAGLMDADKNIAQHLRSREKTTLLVVNKVDGMDADLAMSDFHSLGIAPLYPISASQGRGVTQLIEQVVTPLLPASLQEEPAAEAFAEPDMEEGECSDEELSEALNEAPVPDDRPIKVAIVGKPNVGKSTLTNRILGEERVVVYDMPGTTRDSIYIPMERDGHNYILIDTAGVRRRGKINEVVEKFSVIKTLQAIEDANVVLLVIDAREGVSDQDLSLLGFIINSGRSLVVLVNKWDGLSQEIKKEIRDTLDQRLGFIDFARVHFISALHGSGVGDIFRSIQEAFTCATKRISTSLLTRIMQMAQDEHQPPMVRGRRVKLKYAHAGGYNPPRIVIHGNQLKDLPDSYQRYLTNYFRRSLKIVGTPILIQFNEGENPYQGKRNTLTPNQQRKRQRMMKHLKKQK